MSDNWKKRTVSPKTKADGSPPGWYSRGYLPHFDAGETVQTVTFRLFDSLPLSMLEQWRRELAHLSAKESEVERRKRIEAYLDRGEGSAWMNDPRISDKVQEAILFFDGQRYRLQAWVVMPNHVHALLTPCAGWELGRILHSWKSFTANECNKLLNRSGEFWQTETFDRYVRDERHYHNAIVYIENNPVKAGLCDKPEDWKWSSARIRAAAKSIDDERSD
ncbi:MAG: transposase [Acidobacteriota bacterium]